MLTKVFNMLRNIYGTNKNTCRLVDFDANKLEVVFQLKLKSSVFRMLLIDAVRDVKLLKMLSAFEACCLGGFYGRYIRATQHGQLHHPLETFHLRLNNSETLCRVIALTRQGELIYFDQQIHQQRTADPHVIATTQHIIAKFENSQACYIGFLAGMALGKKQGRKYPVFKVV